MTNVAACCESVSLLLFALQFAAIILKGRGHDLLPCQFIII